MRSVAVVTPAAARTPSAPTMLPLSVPFGIPGRFVDYALQGERERRLAEAMAIQGFRVRDRFAAHLGAALERSGIRPVVVPVARFDTEFLLRLPAWEADALIDPVLEEYGFAAVTPEGPFVPFAVASIRVVRRDPPFTTEERVAINVARPPTFTYVVGPQEPRFDRDVAFDREPARAAAGLDSALRALAATIAGRIR
ncbi:MAG: hypothetical protein RML45_03875 [Acetobacteraceae bacterium]|nr:hypothetical protein [Acetobacteraceae bacterium]